MLRIIRWRSVTLEAQLSAPMPHWSWPVRRLQSVLQLFPWRRLAKPTARPTRPAEEPDPTHLQGSVESSCRAFPLPAVGYYPALLLGQAITLSPPRRRTFTGAQARTSI